MLAIGALQTPSGHSPTVAVQPKSTSDATPSIAVLRGSMAPRQRNADPGNWRPSPNSQAGMSNRLPVRKNNSFPSL